MNFRQPICYIALTVVLVGCVSTEMKSYLGKDIREVVLVNGPPINVLDMGDGSRAFQFMWGGRRSTAITSNSQVQFDGENDFYGKSAITSTGSALASSGCVISYVTKWSDKVNAWVIHDYRYPKKLVC